MTQPVPATAVSSASEPTQAIVLDGRSLTPAALFRIGHCKDTVRVVCPPEALARIQEARDVVDKLVAEDRTVYGLTTGFGKFSETRIPKDKLSELQVRLIRSHAAGVGKPLAHELARMLLALRINVIACGFSGARPLIVERMVEALNADCIPRIPCKGTVGASGDLAPLAHLALGLMGEGQMWNPTSQVWAPAAEVLRAHGLTPIDLHAKEGLAMINGTQFICAVGNEALVRARNIARQADIIAALTLNALRGTARALHPLIHRARPHPGQQMVAARMRGVLHSDKYPSEITESGAVQDAYTLRCVPQVHGVVHDTIDFVHRIFSTELNSATDNPMVFAELDDDVTLPPAATAAAVAAAAAEPESPPADEEPVVTLEASPAAADPASSSGEDAPKRIVATVLASPLLPVDPAPLTFKPQSGSIISGGNFHAEYVAKALDYLAIATTEIANISERRIERLVNPDLSGLPAFLVPDGGLNSGYMMAHVTAAALASENKVLCHPSSVDTISTSAAKEDHVSMGGMSARKALEVVENVEHVVAIELLCACSALDFRRPARTTEPLEQVYRLVREEGGIPPYTQDRYLSPDIERAQELLRQNRVWEIVAPYLDSLVHGDPADERDFCL